VNQKDSKIPTPGLAALVLAVIAGLYAVDKFLAAQEQAELLQEAHSHYSEGQRLLGEGRAREAVQQFSRAHSIERSNREYQLALASAQEADDSIDAARDTLGEVLAVDSNNARANLLMARALARESQFKDADAYYHRAIYGAWPPDNRRGRVDARIELVDMLASHGEKPELLSELLMLQNEPDITTRERETVADLFLRAGAAQTAVDSYRELARQSPHDAHVLESLALAQTALGDYRSARRSLEKAWSLAPDKASIRSQLVVVEKLAELDPTSRRLTSAEKFRRSTDIMLLAVDELEGCLQGTPLPNSLKPLLESAARMKAEKLRGQPTNELAEARLDVAEKLWSKRASVCRSTPTGDDPLPLLMKKLAQ
jgi:Flp pilus assembly protein TadD